MHQTTELQKGQPKPDRTKGRNREATVKVEHVSIPFPKRSQNKQGYRRTQHHWATGIKQHWYQYNTARNNCRKHILSNAHGSSQRKTVSRAKLNKLKKQKKKTTPVINKLKKNNTHETIKSMSLTTMESN